LVIPDAYGSLAPNWFWVSGKLALTPAAAMYGNWGASSSGGGRPAGDYLASGRWEEVVAPSSGDAAWWDGLAGELETAFVWLKRYEIRDPASWDPTDTGGPEKLAGGPAQAAGRGLLAEGHRRQHLAGTKPK
jgi:hypothetical protein